MALTVLTLLTLTLVTRFSSPELILIVRVPAAPRGCKIFRYPPCEAASARDAAGRQARRDVLASPSFFRDLIADQVRGGAEKVRSRSRHGVAMRQWQDRPFAAIENVHEFGFVLRALQLLIVTGRYLQSFPPSLVKA